MKRMLSLCALLAIAGCGEKTTTFPDHVDAGCAFPCGQACCEQGQECRDGECQAPCERACLGRECGPDGCGGTCGTCPSGFSCEEGTCVEDCVGETDEELCARDEKACGTYSTTDSCDRPRIPYCGGCGANEECNTLNACESVCEDVEELCARLQVECEETTAVDNCGEERTVDCGSCEPFYECVLGKCVPCEGEEDAVLCQRDERECGAYETTDRCGRVRLVEDCGSCRAPWECEANACVVPDGVLVNDSCVYPMPLRLDEQGMASHSLDLKDAKDDAAGTCNAQTGVDAVYSFTLPEPMNVEIRVTPTSGYLPHFYLRTTCEASDSEVARSCVEGSSGKEKTLTLAALPAGTYYLWIDTIDPLALAGTLDVAVRAWAPQAPSPEDVCVSAQELPLDSGTGVGTVTGTTVNERDDYAGGCAGGGAPHTGPDVAYYFTLAEPAAVVAQVTSSFRAAVYLRRTCDSAATGHELACSHAVPAQVSSKLLLPGTYYVIVDGVDGELGSFSLTVEAKTPIVNDTCAEAAELALDDAGYAFVRGDTRLALHHDEGACGGEGGADVVYWFTLPELRWVEVTVSPDGLDPVVYLRKSCDAASELACANSSAGTNNATLQVYRLAAGTYYLFVDGQQSKPGSFLLSLVAKEPDEQPANDLCAQAQALAFTDGYSRVQLDTAGAGNDDAGSCGDTHLLNGPDLVYTFTTEAPVSLIARVTPLDSPRRAEPAVYLRNGCDERAVEMGCAHYNAGAAELQVRELAPGAWYLFVDSEAGAAGRHELEVALGDPVRHDTCGGMPQAMVFEGGRAVARGNTKLAEDDDEGSCQSEGRDLVYTFDLAVDSAVSITLTPTERHPDRNVTYRPALYVRQTCDGAEIPGGCATTTEMGKALHLDFARLRAGPYYVFVDGSQPGAAGAFTLTVEAAAVEVPANDACPGEALALGADGKGTATGSTRLAWNDWAGTAECAGGAPEVFYFFEVERSSSVVAKVTATEEGYTPAVAILGGTCDGPVAGCKQGEGNEAIVTLPEVGRGTYYVVVDGAAGQHGAFALEVTVTPLTVINDCNNPVDLTLAGDNEPLVVEGNTALAGRLYSACSGAPGNEIVYRFSTPGPKNLSVTVEPTGGSNARPLVYLRSDCAEGPDLGCMFASASGMPVTLELTRLPQGVWYLFVDGQTAVNGPFRLTLTATTPPPGPANDLCYAAQKVELPVTKLTGETTLAGNDYQGGCPSSSSNAHDGGDVVYYFTVTEPTAVTALVESWDSKNYQPAVYIRSSCPGLLSGDELACGNNSSGKATATATYLVPGTYYVFVDGLKTMVGVFDLTLTPGEPRPNDSCLAPKKIDIVGNLGSVDDTLVGATPHADGSCRANNAGADLVFWFALDGTKDVAITATPGGSARLVVHVREECDFPGSELTCLVAGANSEPVTVNLVRASARSYYVWVENRSTSASSNVPFQLRVVTSEPGEPLPNDFCAASRMLSFTDGVAVETGDTSLAANDDRGTCSTLALPLTGGDLSYLFDVDGDTAVSATVRATGGTFQPALYVRKACSSAWDDEIACGIASGTSTPASVWMPSLPRGAYIVFVDGVAGGRGAFELTVKKGPPQTNDLCASAEKLVFDSDTGIAQASGDNLFGLNDGVGGCHATSGPDLVYAFTLEAPRAVDVELAPAAGSALQPYLHLRSACESPASEIGCVRLTSTGTPATLTYPLLNAGTYYVWADSAAASAAGTFTVKVTTRPPALSPPVNDVCSGAVSIDLSSGQGTMDGSTVHALDSGGAVCNAASGPDVAFQLTTNGAKKLVAEVTPKPGSEGFAPVVYLRASCEDTAEEVVCTTAAAGAKATATVRSLPQGTWYLWVDGASGTRGEFSVSVTLAEPEPGLPNDSCFAPKALVFSGGTATELGATTSGAFNDSIGTCASNPAGDVVYTFTTDQAHKITATVTPQTGFRPTVYLRSRCGSPLPGDELACQGVSSGSAVAIRYNAPPGPQFVWVDGYSTDSAGGFDLEVKLEPPVIVSNDTCESAETLVPGVVVHGTTAGALLDYAMPFGSAACTGNPKGPEVVYTYTPATTGTFTVVVTPQGFDAVLYVNSGSCTGARGCTQTEDSGLTSMAETMVVPAVAGKPYYIFVKTNVAHVVGPFTILLK